MGRMETGKKLQVMYEDRLVGTLALTANHKVAFEYDDAWLEEGFSISPFSLPLKKQVFIPNKDYFEGCLGCLRIACQMRGGACFCGVFCWRISSSQTIGQC